MICACSPFEIHHLQPRFFSQLAGSLGERPETVIGIHHLRRGTCRAWSAGVPQDAHGALIQLDELPAEPLAFGEIDMLLWSLLQRIDGWTAVNVPLAMGPQMQRLIAAETGAAATLSEDVYHVLRGDPADRAHPDVRRLTPDDLPLLADAPPLLRGAGFGGPAGLLREGVAAGAVVAGELVSIAHVSAFSDRYADIGVATLPGYRRQGYAAAGAALVARAVQDEGRTPVWSCGAHNVASLGVADTLGFTEVSRRVYVVRG